MTHTETRFAYRHKPTGKWCYLYIATSFLGGEKFNYVELNLIDSFQPEILYNARNIIEEDLLRSIMNGARYAALNFHEFELVEIEVQYKIKNEHPSNSV
ncbi:MAG: hypothetical protein ACK5DE_01845 [Bacteroidota bacterium]